MTASTPVRRLGSPFLAVLYSVRSISGPLHQLPWQTRVYPLDTHLRQLWFTLGWPKRGFNLNLTFLRSDSDSSAEGELRRGTTTYACASQGASVEFHLQYAMLISDAWIRDSINLPVHGLKYKSSSFSSFSFAPSPLFTQTPLGTG